MSWGNDFLQGIGAGFLQTNYLKDYTHASKTFVANNYELAPRYKFLFSVYFTLNTVEIPQLAQVFSSGDRYNIGIMVKNIQLPSYQMDVEEMNQYNRKRLIQKKVNYQPASVVFHDDGSDLIRNLWYNYFAYYYKDPAQDYWMTSTNGSLGQSGTGDPKYNYNGRDIYNDVRTVNDWGYIGESYWDGTSSYGGKPPFFKDITIFGLNQHQFAAYTMINPLITEWRHDAYDYSDGGSTMENTMTIRYETVKYYQGSLTGSYPDRNAKGFADPAHYDTIKSPLSRGGSTRSVLGPGGAVDTIGGIISDLQSGSVLGLIGAAQKAGAAYQTWKGANFKSVVTNEAQLLAQNVVRGAAFPGMVRQGANYIDGFVFPKTPAQSVNINPTLVKPATLVPVITPLPD